MTLFTDASNHGWDGVGIARLPYATRDVVSSFVTERASGSCKITFQNPATSRQMLCHEWDKPWRWNGPSSSLFIWCSLHGGHQSWIYSGVLCMGDTSHGSILVFSAWETPVMDLFWCSLHGIHQSWVYSGVLYMGDTSHGSVLVFSAWETPVMDLFWCSLHGRHQSWIYSGVLYVGDTSHGSILVFSMWETPVMGLFWCSLWGRHQSWVYSHMETPVMGLFWCSLCGRHQSWVYSGVLYMGDSSHGSILVRRAANPPKVLYLRSLMHPPYTLSL